jgi:MoxR-like ATPase
MLDSIDAVTAAFEKERYVTDHRLATAVFLALTLRKPLLLEGEAGVGKTEVAKVLAACLGATLIRLQGYEGIDINTAVYEWNYAAQIMAIRMAEITPDAKRDLNLYGTEFLIRRPILQAIEAPADRTVVLLIDELDRADDEFDAFLLELLSDFQVTIPELGTIRGAKPPIIILTSNRTRELHDALRRRCLYHWIGYPDFQRELRVVELKAPEATEQLRRQAVRFVQAMRRIDLYKPPGMAETLDWTNGLLTLEQTEITEVGVRETAGLLLKNHDDVEQVERDHLRGLVELAHGA